MTRPVGRYGVYLAGLDPTRGREIAETLLRRLITEMYGE